MEITPNNIRKINEKIARSLKDVEEEFWLTINFSNIKYETWLFKMTLTCKTEDYDKQNWDQYASLYWLEKDMFWKNINIDWKQFIIVWLNTNSKKYPVTCRDVNSWKEYWMTISAIKNAF